MTLQEFIKIQDFYKKARELVDNLNDTQRTLEILSSHNLLGMVLSPKTSGLLELKLIDKEEIVGHVALLDEETTNELQQQMVQIITKALSNKASKLTEKISTMELK